MLQGVDTILIKVASRCNINCSYCYVYNMGDDRWSQVSKFMTDETIEAICSSLNIISKNQKKPFSVVLHGGEPFLLGKIRLRTLLSKIRNVLPYGYPISIQTNGVLIKNDLLDVCWEFRASVAISIDGPKHVHDKYRVGKNGEGSFEAVIKGFEILKSHCQSDFLNAGLLAVVDPTSEPQEVYRFFKSLGPPSVDFLYKDGNHDRLPDDKVSVTSTEYGGWMSRLLDVYLNDPQPLPIRVLDDMLKVLLGGTVTKEGLGITDFGIFIIDTDGTIMKNDTLKSSFNGADLFQNPINVKDCNILEFLSSVDFEEYRKSQRPTSETCLSCPYLSLCGGGMILHRWSKLNKFDNISVYCSDQIHLIDHMQNVLIPLLKHD
jgi:uncharacterized protein